MLLYIAGVPPEGIVLVLLDLVNPPLFLLIHPGDDIQRKRFVAEINRVQIHIFIKDILGGEVAFNHARSIVLRVIGGSCSILGDGFCANFKNVPSVDEQVRFIPPARK